ncbi:PAAR repeat-containing protein [Caballeronia peredens]|nr:PAAR repeat-containing protein [Caballeronia peredens]
MRSPIREYDQLEHGGEVTSGSPFTTFTTFIGRRPARVGDSAQCDLHGITTFAEGDTRFPDRDGQQYWRRPTKRNKRSSSRATHYARPVCPHSIAQRSPTREAR